MALLTHVIGIASIVLAAACGALLHRMCMSKDLCEDKRQ